MGVGLIIGAKSSSKRAKVQKFSSVLMTAGKRELVVVVDARTFLNYEKAMVMLRRVGRTL